jgi:phosphoglycolate phosphatase
MKSRSTMTHRLLWDIDGTLVRGDVVGAEAFELAIERVLGTRPRARVVFSGKTDRQIVEQSLLLEESDVEHAPAVLLHLERELARAVDRIAAEGSPCPGGEAALRSLAAIAGVEQTVLTGNIAPNARLKLAAFGLDQYLDLEAGAYGGEHSDRRDLLPLAWQRQLELRGIEYRPEDTWIVGDTPRDLECARAGRAHCLLVASGRYDFAELEELGADFVLNDLKDTDAVVGVLASA